YLKKVIELTPDSPVAYRNLGHAQATEGFHTEAITALTTAVRLSGGQDALTLHLLARVLADTGNIQDAITTDQQAIRVATAQNNARLMQTINAHLMSLVQQNK
ncbi:MAG: tetratricopeptide repeat protein, partial [Deltaproteobacteria bacterium]|nr:tetratricopeptide repeat protein [Deltaproteobacteria bacterium]